MPLTRTTRLALAAAALLPVGVLLAYPWVYGALPGQWREWADLPRDLIVSVVMGWVLIAVFLGLARGARGRRRQ